MTDQGFAALMAAAAIQAKPEPTVHRGRKPTGPPLPSMSEADLDGHVRRLLRDLRLLGYHTHDSRRSEAGFPDWTIVGPGGLLFRELKTRHGVLTSAQSRWRYALEAASADYAVWRPADLIDGRIAAELLAVTR